MHYVFSQSHWYWFKNFADDVQLVWLKTVLNMKESARLAGISDTNVAIRVNRINNNKEVVEYTKKHRNDKTKIGDKVKLT